MTADYPGSIVSFVAKADGVDWVLAAHINAVQEEIQAIETELGTDVAGSLATLKARLAVSLNDDGTLKSGAAMQDVVDDTSPTLGGDLAGDSKQITGLSWLKVDSPTADYQGLKINGYDDVSSDSVQLDINPDGDARIVATGKIKPITDDSFVLRLGDAAGVYTFTIQDTAYAIIFEVDSDGNTEIAGTLEVAGTVDMKRTVEIVLLDGETSLTTGDDFPDFLWTVPEMFNGYNITDVDFAVETASTSGLPSFQLYNLTQTADILSVNCTIDANELTSYTATTGPTINTSEDDLQTGDQIRFDCDAAGTGTKGCTVILVLEKP